MTNLKIKYVDNIPLNGKRRKGTAKGWGLAGTYNYKENTIYIRKGTKTKCVLMHELTHWLNHKIGDWNILHDWLDNIFYYFAFKKMVRRCPALKKALAQVTPIQRRRYTYHLKSWTLKRIATKEDCSINAIWKSIKAVDKLAPKKTEFYKKYMK